MSTRVACLLLPLSKRYGLKIVQVYASTSLHLDDEVEIMYVHIKSLKNTIKAHFNVVMKDFIAKVELLILGESRVRSHGYTLHIGDRNHRLNFLGKESLYLVNSFFKKKLQRKKTWQSPDAVAKNERN